MASCRRKHGESPSRKKGGAGAPQATGSNPTDRGKAGCKRTLLTDAKGIPLSVVLCGANRHDSKMLMDVLDAVVVAVPPPLEEEQRHLLLDRGYDTPACRQLAVDEGLIAHIPKKATEEHSIPAPDDPERHPARRWVALGRPQLGGSLSPHPDPLGETSRPLSGVCRVDCLPHHLAQTSTRRPPLKIFRIGS